MLDQLASVSEALAEQAQEIARLKAEQTDVRQRLWLNHGCPLAALYGDDGELQCANGYPYHQALDFKREPLKELVLAVIGAFSRRAEAAESALAALTTARDEASRTLEATETAKNGICDAAEMLWVVLANVSGGDWTKQTHEWQEAAARWSGNYFAALTVNDGAEPQADTAIGFPAPPRDEPSWHPIDTAKKLKPVLVYVPMEPVGLVVKARLRHGGEWLTYEGHEIQPTHWMPLPSPPLALPSPAIPQTRRDEGVEK